MTIIDALHDAATEHEIRFLLTAYVDAVRHFLHGEPESAPAVWTLPLGGLNDVEARLAELESETREPRDARAPARDEAVSILRAAAQRLRVLEKEKRRELTGVA